MWGIASEMVGEQQYFKGNRGQLVRVFGKCGGGGRDYGVDKGKVVVVGEGNGRREYGVSFISVRGSSALIIEVLQVASPYYEQDPSAHKRGGWRAHQLGGIASFRAREHRGFWPPW